VPTPEPRPRLRRSRRIALSALIALLCVAVLPHPTSAAPPKRKSHAADTEESAVRRLRSRVRRLLKEKRFEDAVRAAQIALRDAPDSPAVRREFVDLHLSIARSWLAEERFDDAATALDAALRAQPNETDALRLRQSIEAARRAAPTRVARAREWIDLEWYEPAFNTFRQAIALRPERRGEWLRDYRASAVGAGDDDYVTKNFHQAFYYYDAAIQIGLDAEIPAEPGLVSRWMQSLVHALDDDGRIRYPQAYWKVIFQRIAETRYDGPDAPALRATLEGLAFEHAGDRARAAQAYGQAIGKRLRGYATNVSAIRRTAIESLRRLYDVEAIGRRSGEWARNDTDEMQLYESPRFRIHHRNAVIAQRVGRALDFHFARIADDWALDLDEIPWEEKADIYLHTDRRAFFEATGQSAPVTAVSQIRLQGGAVRRKIIHAHLSDPMLLSSSLAHELAHLITAEIRRDRPLPAIIAEGLALHVEPQCRHRQFARLFEDLKRPAGVKRLLAFSDVHPTDAAFYAEAHRLMTVLRSRAHPADLMGLSGENIDASVLARRCDFGDARQLQSLYSQMAPQRADRRATRRQGSTN